MVGADDINMPERLDVQSRFLEENREVGVVGSASRILNGNNPHYRETDYETIKVLFLRICYLCHGTTMIRTSLVKKHDLYYNEKYTYASDYDWLARALSLSPGTNTNEVLYEIRRHARQITTSKSKEQFFFIEQIRIKQLSFFGIDPTEDEKELHRSFIRGVIDHRFEKEMVDRWIDRLLEANQGRRYYSQQKLENFFTGTPLSMCFSNKATMNPYKMISDTLDVFVRQIAKTSYLIPQNGLMTGKMGVAILLYRYGRYRNDPEMEEYADRLIELVFQKIGQINEKGFDNGVYGIVWGGMNYLIKQGFLQADEDIFDEIDTVLLDKGYSASVLQAFGIEAEKGLYILGRFISDISSTENKWCQHIENCVNQFYKILISKYTSLVLPVFPCIYLIRFFSRLPNSLGMWSVST